MKKIYLTILTSMCVLGVNAQSLTQASTEPIIGDVNIQKGYDTTTVLPNATGTGQTWNFSALTSNTITEMSTYTTVAAGGPNKAAFTTATLSDNDGTGNYNYYKSTATQFEVVGFESTVAVVNFSNTAIAAVWPITMGYSNTDVAAGSAAVNGTLTGTANGTITTTGSGTGTLIIPGGATFTNILQTKTIQTVLLNLAGGFVTANIRTVDYSYYHGTQKFPLLTVSYNNTTGTFPATTATVRVNNAVITGINDLNFDATFAVFPNPAKESVNVKLHNDLNADCNIEILNSLGQAAQVNNLGNATEISENISISTLSSGIYFVKTTLGNRVSVRKLIID